jgi:AAA-like domain
MNEAEFEEKYLAITKFQRPILTRLLLGESDTEIASALGSTKENVRQHISKVCQGFNIQNKKGEFWGLREDLVEIFRQHKPEMVGKRWLNELADRQAPINFPSGAISIDSLLYIERELVETGIKRSIEADIKIAITEPRALIRIIAPSKFGKTSLLLRIESHAKTQNFRTAYINIKQEFDRERLENYGLFTRYLCALISEQIDSASDVPWQDRLTPQMNCTRYIEILLNQTAAPIVLILDGVEALYSTDIINQEFFQMLRRWHDNGAVKESWRKIRQIIVYSSDNYGTVNLDRSPFNIGRHYELTEFNESEILELAKQYRLNWDKTQVSYLMSSIAGHPYLVNLALYHFATHRDLSLEQFSSESSINSIYQSYLDSLANYLERNSELRVTLDHILNPKKESFWLEDRLKHILYSMGLIKYLNSEIMIRCKLYQQYFQKYLLSRSEH